MFHDDGHALIIGIDDYSAFDRSTGKPEGTSSLAGSVLDAHVFFRLCTELGMKPENIRVVASPRPDLTLFPGAAPANIGEASETGIRDAIGWLSDKLAGGGAGIMTYSGHGAHTRDQGLLLCPSDTAGARFDHAIPFHELRAALGEGAKNLTVVLDCCHGGSPAEDGRGRRARTLGGDALVPGERADDMMIGARVLAACRPGEATQQASFGGMPHGAFSWAFGTVVDQWKAVDQGGNVRLDLSYGTFVEKARQLLAVLDFTGTPALYGPPGVESMAVLQVGSRPEQTSAVPDGERGPIELDAGSLDWKDYKISYTDNSGSPVTFLAIFAMKNTKGTFVANTEYWYQKGDKGSSASVGTSNISFSSNDGSGTPSPPSWSPQNSYSVADSTRWSSAGSTDPYAGQGKLYASGNLGFRLIFDSAGSTLQSVVWYKSASSSPTGHITPSGAFAYQSGGTFSARAGYGIYLISATLSPA